MQQPLRELNARRRQGRARADRDAVAPRLLADHVQRLRRGDAETAPLADRIALVAVVVAEQVAADRDDLAARRRGALLRTGGPRGLAVAAQEPPLSDPGEKAQVLALGTV